jgi:hypothetical protein
MQKRHLVVAGLTAVALAGCGSSSGSGSTADVTPSTETASSPAPLPTASLPAASAAPNTIPPPTSKPAESSSFVMPNEVGKVLQDAQDDLQSVSGNPLYFSTSSDATGAGRHQILDRDWKVCSQSIPPGTTVTSNETPDFAVVRVNTETCP